MTIRNLWSPLVVLAALPLGGCVYAAAAGAVGSVIGQAAGGGEAAALDPAAARTACTERAAQHGEVRVIDVETRRDRIRVYGTVESAGARRAFRCDHRGDRITGFDLRQTRRPTG